MEHNGGSKGTEDVLDMIEAREHNAVFKGTEDMVELVERCVQCCNSYHCPLCPTGQFRPTVKKKVISHLKTTHWKTRVEGADGKVF